MELEQEAMQMGWVPLERFRGDPEKWVDAETFVSRGKEVMPILKANNARLQEKLTQTTAMTTALQGDITELRATIEEMTKFQREEVQRQVDAQIERLKLEKRTARREANDDRVDEIEDELEELAERKTTLAKAPAAAPTPQPKPGETPQGVDPAFVEWSKTRPWVSNDPIKGSLALGVAQKLRIEGTDLSGVDFYDEVERRVEEFFAAPRTSKTEGAGGGGSGGSSRQLKGGYSSLPAEAKAVCDRQAEKFVGPNKQFKTLPEWQAHYAKLVSEAS